MSTNTRLIVSGIATAIALGLSAQVSFPSNPIVPGTLQCLAIMLTGSLFGMRASVLGGLLYLIGGASGIPWFSGMDADMTVTGGYILGFVPALAIVGIQADKNNLATFTSSLGTYLVALIVVYLSGFLWLVQYAGIAANQAYTDGIQATFVGDVLEIIVVAALVGLFSQYFKRSAQ